MILMVLKHKFQKKKDPGPRKGREDCGLAWNLDFSEF